MITLEAGRTIAGKYRLERPLAKGGMGAVWVARHVQLDVLVAVKFMDPDTAASDEARMRFDREAKASAQLKSPHVVQVHDYGIEDTTPYIVMELLDGEDLSARLKREGRLSLAATSALLGQLGKGLRRAHEAGVVHRDLKPGNIFLQRQDDDVVVKILDFGIAKSIVAGSAPVGDATKTGSIMGSPHYMSPEQFRDSKSIDHRTDLWAVGVILFRCLTGVLPFPGSDFTELILAIFSEPMPIPSTIAPDLGPEVDRFFERALARDLNQRFQSVRELVDAFMGLEGARPPGAARGDPRGSLPSLPDSMREDAGAPFAPQWGDRGHLKSDSGASGAVPGPHVIGMPAPQEGSSNSGRSAASVTSSGHRHVKAVAAAVGVALLAAAIGLIVVLRAGAQPPSSAGASTVPAGPQAPTREPSSAAPQQTGPSVTPVSPTVTAPASASAASAAPAGSPSARSPQPGTGRPPPAKRPATQDPQNPILGF